MYRKIFILLLFILLFSATVFANNNIQKQFIKANKFYEQHNYFEAVKNYEDIYNRGIKNGYLFYNIGTSYLKMNKIGKSLYWFDKASFFIPLNSSLNKNIQIAISKAKDNFQNRAWTNYLDGIFFLTKLFSIKSLFYLASLFYMLLFIIVIIRFFTYNVNFKRNINRAITVVGIFFVTFTLNFSWDYYKYKYLKIGYIIANNVEVKNDFNIDADNIMEVNDGTKVIILEENRNFLYVKFPDNSKGWVEKDKIVK